MPAASMAPVRVRLLGAEDAEAFQVLRLRALLECPTAFASSHAEEAGTPVGVVASRLAATASAAIFGAFAGDALVGVAGLQREAMTKLAHKACLWGVYVAPAARRRGLAQRLVQAALEHGRTNWIGLRQVFLGVNVANEGALALYRGLGFEVYGTERGFLLHDGMLHDEHHMVRVLA